MRFILDYVYIIIHKFFVLSIKFIDYLDDIKDRETRILSEKFDLIKSKLKENGLKHSNMPDEEYNNF